MLSSAVTVRMQNFRKKWKKKFLNFPNFLNFTRFVHLRRQISEKVLRLFIKTTNVSNSLHKVYYIKGVLDRQSSGRESDKRKKFTEIPGKFSWSFYFFSCTTTIVFLRTEDRRTVFLESTQSFSRKISCYLVQYCEKKWNTIEGQKKEEKSKGTISEFDVICVSLNSDIGPIPLKHFKVRFNRKA